MEVEAATLLIVTLVNALTAGNASMRAISGEVKGTISDGIDRAARV